jgi:hypothetical protein
MTATAGMDRSSTVPHHQIPTNSNKGKKIHQQLKNPEGKKMNANQDKTGHNNATGAAQAAGPNLNRKEKKRLKKLEAAARTGTEHAWAAAPKDGTGSSSEKNKQHVNVSAIAAFVRPMPVVEAAVSVRKEQLKSDSSLAPATVDSSEAAKKKKKKKKAKSKKHKETSIEPAEPLAGASCSISSDLVQLARSYYDYAACQLAELRWYSRVDNTPESRVGKTPESRVGKTPESRVDNHS